MSSTATAESYQRSFSEIGAVLFALVFPLFAVLLYFVGLASASPIVQSTAYSVAKVVQFGFPLFWVVLVLRQTPRDLWAQGGTLRQYIEGASFGLLVLVGMLALHAFWLKPVGLLAEDSPAAAAIYEKVRGFQLTSPWRFVAFGLFVSAIHSLAEEYYWRWFVFGRLQKLIAWPWAVFLASLGFMAHHVVILGVYFGWASPATWLFSLGVAVGGGYWCWLYHRTGSLLPCWLSHAVIDVAIFIIGYDMLHRVLVAGG